MIDLTVKTLDSQNHVFSLEDDQITVRRFKEYIADSVAVPADSQRLIYCGRVLQDEKKLNDYDVNGKVIHLVQRAPPQPWQRNNDSGQNQGQPQGQGWQNQQRSHYRLTHAQMHGNAMYLGAMSVPAEIIEGNGLAVPRLSNSLSNSRLIVARRMLNHANDLMDRLDDPTIPLNPSTSDTNQAEQSQEDNGENRTNGGTRLSEAVVAAIGAALSAASASNVTLIRGSNEDASETRTTTDAQEDAEMDTQPSPQSQNEQGATSNANGQTNRRPSIQLPRPPQMAQLLERLLSTQDRLRPYIERYRVLMLADPSLPPGAGPEGVEENQRIVDGVSECLHYMSHACHALSDIIVDMGQQPPRNLRCRPIIIQHSAILHTGGVPIQAHISLHGRNANNNNGTEETSENTNAQQPSDIVVASGSIEVTTDDNNQSQESANTAAPQATEEQRRSQEQQRPQSPFVIDLRNNVEVLMEVSPESNMEASLGSDQNQTGENNNNNNAGRTIGNAAGVFPLGSAPSPDFLRTLMQAVAGHMVQGGITTALMPTRNPATTVGVQQTTASSMDNGSTNGAQNTQARSTVGTHPTTVTQTRSTSRPHVFHQHAHAPGFGTNATQGLDFDPFLPCNSHHVRRTPSNTPNVSTIPQTTRSSQTSAQGTQAQTQTTAPSSTSSSSTNTTSTTSSTSTQGVTNNSFVNLLRQMLGGAAGQQQTGTNPDLAESFGNIMQMIGGGNVQIGIVGDGGINIVGGRVTLADLLENGGLAMDLFTSHEPGREENFLVDLAVLVAQNMPLEDLFRLRFGRWEPIAQLRRPLQEFLQYSFSSASSPEEIQSQATERLISQLHQHIQTLLVSEEDVGGRSGSQIDICATVEVLLSQHCKDMLRLVLDNGVDDARFGQEILSVVNNLGRRLCTVLRYSIRGGQAGLEAVASRFVTSMLEGIHPSIRQWLLNGFIAHFRTYSLRIPQPPDSEILPLLVYKEVPSQTSSMPSATVQPVTQTQRHEAMEVEPTEEKPSNEAAIPDDSEDIPETFPGHEVLPTEWIPIIARDGVRQRRQLQMQGMANGSMTTFSDAYLGGLPTKRRKLIEQQKPRLLVSPTPNHSAISASMERLVRDSVSRAGVEEVEGAAVAVAADSGVRRAFGQAIRDCLNPHRYATPDFPDPIRFPNATKYFADQERPSK